MVDQACQGLCYQRETLPFSMLNIEKIACSALTYFVFRKLCYYYAPLKGELQRENKLISYERAFKMLENDMYIAGIGQAVPQLSSFKVE